MDATNQQPDSTTPRISAAPAPRALHLAASVCAWLVLLAGAILAAQRIAVTGPAGMSLPRATFFILNAASLTGFEMTWASPETMTSSHAALWLLGAGSTSLLGLFIATAAMARASGWDWAPARILLIIAAFLAGLWMLAFLAESTGAGCRAAAWNGLMVATGTGLLAGDPDPRILWYARYPLAAIAAIGPFVLIDTLRRRRLTRQSQVLGVALPVAFLLSIAAMVAAQSLPGAPLLPAATAAADAVAAGGAGFTRDTVSLSPAARWTLIPVLLLGGASGGIGGGLKAVTAAVLVIGLARLLRGTGGAGRTFAIAAVWLAGLAVLFGVTFVLLQHTSPQLRPDRAALLAAAACGNSGISIDPVTVAGNDAYVLAAAMLLGRALPWVVLWWSAARGDEPLAVG